MNNTQQLYYHFIFHTLKNKYLFIFIGDNNISLKDIQSDENYTFFNYSEFKKDNIKLINKTIYYEDTILIIKAKIYTYLNSYIPNISSINELYLWKSNLIYTNQLYYILSIIFNNEIIKLNYFIQSILDIFNINIGSEQFKKLLKSFNLTENTFKTSKKNIDFKEALNIFTIFIQKNYKSYDLSNNKIKNILLYDSSSDLSNKSIQIGGGENEKENDTIEQITLTNSISISNNDNNNVKNNENNTKKQSFTNSTSKTLSSILDFNSKLFSDDSQVVKYLQDLDKNITQQYQLLYNDNLEFYYYNILSKQKLIYNLNPYTDILNIDNNFINKQNEENDNINYQNFNYQIENTIVINFTTIIDVIENIPKQIRDNSQLTYYAIIRKYFPKILYNKTNYDKYFKTLITTKKSTLEKGNNFTVTNFKKNLDFNDYNMNIIYNTNFSEFIHNDELINIFIKYLYFTIDPIKTDFISLDTIFNKFETNKYIIAAKLYNQFGNHTYKINKDMLNTLLISGHNSIKDFKHELFNREFISPTEFKKQNKDYSSYMIFFININDEQNTIITLILFDNGRYDVKYELKKTSNINLTSIFESFHIINNLLSNIEKSLFYYYSFYKLNSDILFKKLDFVTINNIFATTQITYFPYNIDNLPLWINKYGTSLLQFISNSTSIKSNNSNKIYYYKYKNFDKYNERDNIFESYAKYLHNSEYKTASGKKKLENFISHIFNIDYNYLKSKGITKDDETTYTKYNKQAFNIPNTIKLNINNNNFMKLEFININKFNNIYILNKYILTLANIFHTQLQDYTNKYLLNNNYHIFHRIINNTYKLFEKHVGNNTNMQNYKMIQNNKLIVNDVDIKNEKQNNDKDGVNNDVNVNNNSNNTNANLDKLMSNGDFNSNNFQLNTNVNTENDNNVLNTNNVMNDNNNAPGNDNNKSRTNNINNINNANNNNDNIFITGDVEKINEAFIIDQKILDNNLDLFNIITNNGKKVSSALMNKIKSLDHYINPEYFDKNNKIINCKDADAQVKHYLIYNKYKQIDKPLFSSDAKYSKKCPSGNCRKPIIITEKEREIIDKEFPGSYIDYIKVGSTDKIQKKYVYFCPNLWCPSSRLSITREYYDKHKSCPVIKGNPKSGEQPIDFQLPSYFAKVNKETGTSLDMIRYHRFPVFIQGTSLPCCMKTRYNPDQEDDVNKKLTKFVKHDPKNIYQTYRKSLNKKDNELDIIKDDNYILSQSQKILEVDKYGELIPEIYKILYNNYITSDDRKINIFRKGIVQNSYNFIVSVIYLLDNPKIKNYEDFIKIIQLNMSPFDYMQFNNGATLKKYHNPSKIPILDKTIIENEESLEKLLLNIKNLLQWHSLHSIYITHFNLEEFYNVMIKINNINKLKTFLQDSKKNQNYIDIIKRELIIYISFKNFIKYLKNYNINKDIDDIYDIFSNKYSDWMNIHKYTLIVFNNEKMFDKKGKKKIGSKNYIYIPKYSSINDLNHLSNCIFVSKINNKYEPLVILEYLKSSSDKRSTKLREFKVFHHNFNHQFLSKINSLLNIYKNTYVNKELLYFNNAYTIFKYLSTNIMDLTKELYIKAFVINYNFKLTGFLLQNNFYIPLEFDTEFIPKNLIPDLNYYEIKYMYIDEIFNLKVDVSYKNFNNIINIFIELNTIINTKFYYVTSYISTNHKVEKTQLNKLLEEKFTKQFYDVQLFDLKKNFFKFFDIHDAKRKNNKSPTTYDILKNILKDGKFDIVAIYYDTKYYDKFSIINLHPEYKTIIYPIILNKYIVLNSNFIISNVFNNLEHLYFYNNIFNQILIKIIENNNYTKEIYYIKHPVNPLPNNLKIKYISNIINSILTEHIDIKKDFIKLIQMNLIKPTTDSVNNIYNTFISNMTNDILLKEINYLLQKISDVHNISYNDIYMTHQDYNNKFNYHIKKIQNLYQHFYSTSNDNIEYINLNELNTSVINYSKQIFNQIVTSKLKKTHMSKPNEYIQTMYNLTKEFELFDFDNNLIILFNNISQLLKYDTTNQLINDYIISHFYNLLTLNDSKAKYNLLYHLYHNDEVFFEYINSTKKNISDISKNDPQQILDLFKNFILTTHNEKLYFSHFIVEFLSEYFQINVVVINYSKKFPIDKVKCYINNNSTNYLFLYYENKEFKLVLLNNKLLNTSYIYDIKLIENYFPELYESIATIFNSCKNKKLKKEKEKEKEKEK